MKATNLIVTSDRETEGLKSAKRIQDRDKARRSEKTSIYAVHRCIRGPRDNFMMLECLPSNNEKRDILSGPDFFLT